MRKPHLQRGRTAGADSRAVPARKGFTLLELMAAMVILTIAMSVAFEAFSATIRGWKRGTEVVEGLQHGDYAMSQFVSALNSTIFFNNPRKTYAFLLERGTVDGLPADTISFVTASRAFMPADSPLNIGPHRLELFIENDEKGNPALYALFFPAVADFEEIREEFNTEPHLVSRAVQGLEVLFFDEASEEWSDSEWERDNAIPDKVMLTVFVGSDEEEPIAFTRILEIPVAESLKMRLRGATPNKRGGR